MGLESEQALRVPSPWKEPPPSTLSLGSEPRVGARSFLPLPVRNRSAASVPRCPIFPPPQRDIPNRAEHPLLLPHPRPSSIFILSKRRKKKKKKSNATPNKRGRKKRGGGSKKSPEPHFFFSFFFFFNIALFSQINLISETRERVHTVGKLPRIFRGQTSAALLVWSWRLYRR